MTIHWTPELELSIADRLLTRPLTKICDEDQDVPSYSSICRRMLDSPEFDTLCTRARRKHALYRLERASEIADACTEDNAKSSKVRIDFATWNAERLLSKEYGNKLQSELSGPDGGPLQAQITVEFVKPVS